MNIKKIKPLFTAVVVTAKVYPADYKEGSILSPKAGKLMEYQEVIAVGDSCRSIEVGNLVCIDLSSYADWKYKKNSIKSDMEELTNEIIGYHVPQITIDGKKCLYLDIRDIKYIVEEYDDKENEEPLLITPDKGIIIS